MRKFYFPLRERLEIEGIMPERALLRLKRAQIPVYDVEKKQKNRILLRVEKKDVEKVFAIYPNVCYNDSAYHPYFVRKKGAEGLGFAFYKLAQRTGLIVGALLFMLTTLVFDGFIFGVDVVGATAYTREVCETLEENGVKTFAPYRSGKEDLISAKLLALDGVEFCSVKKTGARLRVELRLSPFPSQKRENGAMLALRSGTIENITVLRGSALKKAGDGVQRGEALVGDWILLQDGGQVRVQPIARVRISCVHEELVQAEDEETAFWNVYLGLQLKEGDDVLERRVQRQDGGYFVSLRYAVTETVNLE